MFWKRSNDGKKQGDGAFSPSTPSGPRSRRHSSGWAAVFRFLKETEGAVVMDVGPTSPSNVNFLTTLGCSIFLPDPLHDAVTGGWAAKLAADDGVHQAEVVEQFLAECFSFAGRSFDCVLLWDTLEYLPEPLVKPVVDRIYEVVKPGGRVLCFCHARLEEGTGTHRRYHVTASDDVESQAGAGYPQVRVLQNRNMERLFEAFSQSKFSLAGDNLREVVFTR